MNWIRQLFTRRRLNTDLWEEIQQHLDEKADEFVAGGMSRRDAIAAARREFGHVAQIEQTSGDVWRWRLVDDLFSDIRFAFRQLRNSPAFAVAGILTLALGIGANTAVFSVVDAVALRPLAYPESDRVVSVQLRSTHGELRAEALCYPTFFDFRRDNRVFENLVSYRLDDFVLTGSGSPTQVRGAIVSWDLFALLKIQPELGRGFLPQEERSDERSVVISHGLWQRRFGGDASIVGRTINVDREPHTVVGIAPPGFHFPPQNASLELWTTLSREAGLATAQPLTEQRSARVLKAIARLRPGVSVEQAQVQMDMIAAAEAKQYPDQNGGVAATYIRPALDSLVGDLRQPMFLLLGAVGLVLLIACANIANLLLARTAERQREFALRAAIGATRSRIVRQVIAESLVLSLTGCTLGVLAAAGLLSWALPLAAESMPRVEQAGIDARVLMFSIGLAMLTSLLFSFAPAARLLRAHFKGLIQEGSRTVTDRSDRVRGALIAGQVALGLVLLSGASLLIASFVHLMRRDLGLQPERVVTFSVNLPSAEYPRAKQIAFHSRLLEKLAGLPDATSAATAMPLPLSQVDMGLSFEIDGRPAPPSQRLGAKIAIVSPQYFRAMGIPILRGREFTEHDAVDAPAVAIVNRAFADRFFPNEDALGKHIKPSATSDSAGPKMREVAGIVGNAKQSPLGSDAEPIYYLPYEQIPWCCPSIAVRTAGSPVAIEAAIRGIVESLDKQLAVSDVRTLDALLYEGVARPRFQMLLLTSFAGIALLLTVVGLYGVMTYSVVKRTRELGVRIALGAGRDAVFALVLKQAMLLVSIGIAMGLAGSWATGRLMTKMVYGVSAGDPFLLAAATGLITITATLAAYLPARRAASIDPMRALRME